MDRGRQFDARQVACFISAWAAIFAVGTLIVGIYGMNFALVPRDQTVFVFWFAVGLMAVSSVTLYVFFKRKGWL